MKILILFGLACLAYLVGGIPFCYLLGKLSGVRDIREVGDRNVGAVNLMANVNKFYGLLGGMLDFGKGALAFYMGVKFSNIALGAYLCAVAAVAGHNWSPYLRFTGGKGLATSLGGLALSNFLNLAVFGVVVVSLLVTTRSMLKGVLGALASTFLFLFFVNRDIPTIVYALLLLAVVTPKYVLESIELRSRHGTDRRSIKDLFSARPR